MSDQYENIICDTCESVYLWHERAIISPECPYCKNLELDYKIEDLKGDIEHNQDKIKALEDENKKLKEIKEAGKDVLEWIESNEVEQAFNIARLHIHTPRDFCVWAGNVIHRFKEALKGVDVPSGD
jgi:hypothetical protein